MISEKEVARSEVGTPTPPRYLLLATSWTSPSRIPSRHRHPPRRHGGRIGGGVNRPPGAPVPRLLALGQLAQAHQRISIAKQRPGVIRPPVPQIGRAHV